MKFIYISNSKMPATSAHGLQIMQMCQALAENGAEVELMVPRRIGARAEDPFDYYGVKRNFKITKVPCLDFIFWSDGGFFFLLQLLSFLFFCQLKIIFTNRKYDVLYSRDYLAGIFFRRISLELHSLPKKASRLYLKALRRAETLVVLTSFIKERMVKLGVNPDKIAVLPDAVNLGKFDIGVSKEEARKKLGLPNDKKLVGYVGMLRTLGMEKGIDVAVKALSGMKDKNICLVLVGGYKADIELYKKSAERLGVADRIIFTGMVRHDLVPIYLKALDVLTAPFPENEHYSFYMSPLKIFEYMASGRPIVATNLPSLKEILDGSNSVLVAPGDSSELAAAIEKVLTDKKFADKISAKALADVGEYTWRKRAKKVLDLIELRNIRAFSSELSVEEYSKKYLRAGEDYLIKKYMPEGSRVLDLGCGAGRTTSYIYESGAEVVGADISEPLVARAQKDYPEIDFRVMDARSLDFPNGSFDVVFFSFNGLDNLLSLEERDRAIEEIKRVLKPGGFFIYSSHNSLSLPRTRIGFGILADNLTALRIGPHYRVERHGFGELTQYYNNVWNEMARLEALGWRNVEVIGNGRRFLHAPKFVLAILDKFPIYIARK